MRFSPPGLASAALMMLLAPGAAAAATGDLGAYMKARAAAADGEVAAATSDYARALAAAPDTAVVAVRAYREAVRAGDLALADRAAASLADQGVAPADAALLALARAARSGDRVAAGAAIARLRDDQLRILAAPLAAWAALDAGDDPFAPLARAPADVVSRRFVDETRALLLIATGRVTEGEAALRLLLGNDLASQDHRVAAARLLLGRGEGQAARRLLAAGGESAITTLRAAATDPALAGRYAAKPSLAFGASYLFTRVASDLAVGAPGPLTYTLLQAALRADPGNDRARVLLAGVLARDDAVDRALAVLDAVPPTSLYAPIAATGRIQLLADDGRDAEALAAARELGAAADAATDDVQRLADLNIRLGRPAEAVPLYRRLIDRAGPAADWADWLQYGAALDEAKRWDQARPALERAVNLGPSEPLALNYLGYALVQRRERLGDAQKLLERAAALKPDDAAIADSLGWALLVRGQRVRALPLLERAALGDPANAEIGEHLGDAYWTAGRRYEARYAWTAARQVADADDAVRLDAKIARGIGTLR